VNARDYFFTPLRALPSLPSGASYFLPTNFELTNSSAKVFHLSKLTLLGTLDISGPTFTDGNVAPTIIEGGVSRQIPSGVLMVVDTALMLLLEVLQLLIKTKIIIVRKLLLQWL